MITVFFVDDGQDFLEWDIDDEGKVVDCRPFQGDIWIGMTVHNKDIKPGDLLDITTPDARGRTPWDCQLIHAVEKVQQPMEGLVKKCVDTILALGELSDELTNKLNEQNVVPFCRAVAEEMRRRGVSEDAIDSTLKGMVWGRENWDAIVQKVKATPSILEPGGGQTE